MEQLNGHPCPECGTPRQPDNTPSCTCTHRAAEALHNARTTEAAAAEDFDPLRIRPYVELAPDTPTRPPENEGTPGRPSANGPAEHPHAAALHAEAPAQAGEGAPRQTQADGATTSPQAEASHVHAPGRTTDDAPRRTPRRAADDAPPPSQNHPAEPLRTDAPARAAEGGAPRRPVTNPGQASRAQGAPSPSPADATMPLRPVDPDATTLLPASPDTSVLPVSPPTSVLPTPLAPGAAELSVTDLRLFAGTAGPGRGLPEPDEAGRRPRRRRRNALLAAAAGACVAVVAAAGYASGLFSYEAPTRESALPDDLRASVPDAPSSSAASTPPAESAQAAPSAPAAPPPPATRSPSASPSPSTPSASPSPSQSATPSASRTSAPASPENVPPGNSRQNGGPTVLRLGDRGPEVTELQLRLRQLYLYDQDTDGDYDSRLEEAVRTYQWSRGIQTDDLGVYDRETRAKLESETKEP